MDLKELKITNKDNRHPWEIARFEVIYKLIRLYAPKLLEKETTVLDIGCGDTFFVKRLASRSQSNRFFAIDTAFDEEMLEAYNSKLVNSNIGVYKNLYDINLAEENEKADGVLLLDVIEHIPNDILFLKELVSNPIITNKTIFIITVPAFQSLFCSHDVFLAHYRRYDNQMLAENIRKAGLQPLQIGYFFFSLLPARMIKVCMEKVMQPKENISEGVGGWQSNKIKEIIFKNMLMLDFKIMMLFKKIGIQLPGLSNFIICKRSA